MHGPRSILLEPREVPLGGVRAMNVQRILPNRELPTIGAWCFFDRFGPDEVRMRVEPHPHIGLQTVTWPLVGEVRHRDTLDSDVVLRRGQLNLMTAGNGIAHSEYSVGDGPVPLDALQFWVVLPEASRHRAPGFEQHTDLPRIALPSAEGPDAAATVVLGDFAGVRSPATVFTPIVGAEIELAAGSRIRVPLDPAWEHGIVLVEGEVRVIDGDIETVIPHGELLFLGDSRDSIDVLTSEGAQLFLLGGEPFDEGIVMWWNFAGRTHEEIVQAREDWEADAARFGTVPGHGDVRIPAPPIPPVRLKARYRSI
ncbi:redox-sensitive bicupin YhaK (pirin superfamily) [Microbacterium keratanolyticum]|uniref:Pirin n=1 Tax=Microbacterium keratanolyticum TaxID=67574 RepID=A0A9W6M7V9_9MICO|nr:pirin family protein [Microbacterium keratanolyticum]MBM7468516.1 redox-sensitive bicupin YhaK (pirin superfamily) [Microbacterium keratanolyticum]GLK00591.1 hypothetical protein GCM10017596_03060 [Microbacterium keratanolyticum]